MNADQRNLLCYVSIQVVKIMARDLGKRALHRTMGNRAFSKSDIRHLERLCGFIYKVDPKMGELAIKVVAQNSPQAQEQELLRSIRSVLGPDFFDKEYGNKGKNGQTKYEVTVVQEDEGGTSKEIGEVGEGDPKELGEAKEA